jgi:uncharacterized membrane protein
MHQVFEDIHSVLGWFPAGGVHLTKNKRQAVDDCRNTRDARLSPAQKGVNERVHRCHSATPTIDTQSNEPLRV